MVTLTITDHMVLCHSKKSNNLIATFNILLFREYTPEFYTFYPVTGLL